MSAGNTLDRMAHGVLRWFRHLGCATPSFDRAELR